MSSSQSYSVEFQRRIVKEVLDGKSVEVVAAEWQLDAQLIRTWVKEHSIERTSGSRRTGLASRASDDDGKQRDWALGGRKAARKVSGRKKRARKAAGKKRARKAAAKKSARKAAARKKR
jgi:transposase-like protein